MYKHNSIIAIILSVDLQIKNGLPFWGQSVTKQHPKLD